MTAQADFAVHTSAAVSASNTEIIILAYQAPSNEPVDVIITRLSHGTPGSTPPKVIWRIRKGGDAPTSGSSETPIRTGRLDPGSLGSALRNPTFGSDHGDVVWMNLENPAVGDSAPEVFGLDGGEWYFLTAEVLTATSTNCYGGFRLRKPALS